MNSIWTTLAITVAPGDGLAESQPTLAKCMTRNSTYMKRVLTLQVVLRNMEHAQRGNCGGRV